MTEAEHAAADIAEYGELDHAFIVSRIEKAMNAERNMPVHDRLIADAFEKGIVKRVFSVGVLGNDGKQIGIAQTFHSEINARIFVKELIEGHKTFKAWATYSFNLEL